MSKPKSSNAVLIPEVVDEDTHDIKQVDDQTLAKAITTEVVKILSEAPDNAGDMVSAIEVISTPVVVHKLVTRLELRKRDE